MRKLLVFVAACLSVLGQVQTTSIVGPVFDAFGNPYTGSFVVRAQAKTNTGWAITGTQRTVFVTGGVIGALSLVPNDTSVPNLTSYQITFANGDSWVCIIPTSTVSISFTSACTPDATRPNVGSTFSASSVIPSPNNGDVFMTFNGISQWRPFTPIPLAATSPILFNSSTGVFGCQSATSTTSGCLPFADWVRFNAKQDAIGFTPENLAKKGSASGYAPLDSSARLPLSYLSNSGLPDGPVCWSISSGSLSISPCLIKFDSATGLFDSATGLFDSH